MPFNPVRNPVNVLELDGKKSPGLATIRNAASMREWVERGGYGQSGGFSIFKRRKLAHPVVEFRLYTAEDWDAWHEWAEMIYRLPRTRAGQTPAGGYLRAAHPILEDLGIKALGVEKIGQPDQTEDGVWTIVVEFIEFQAPQITLAKPEATKPTKPLDPVEEEIRRMREENQALLDRLARDR
jgi:hypothetical protein